jgi:hypothetical protein
MQEQFAARAPPSYNTLAPVTGQRCRVVASINCKGKSQDLAHAAYCSSLNAVVHTLQPWAVLQQLYM